MAKGASGSQAAAAAPRGSAGAPPTAAGLRKRSTRTAGGGGGGSGSGQARASFGNFFTDDTIGIKVSPTAVMVMSLGYICFVTLLHIIGKIRGV